MRASYNKRVRAIEGTDSHAQTLGKIPSNSHQKPARPPALQSQHRERICIKALDNNFPITNASGSTDWPTGFPREHHCCLRQRHSETEVS